MSGEKLVNRAVEILRGGGLVAFPTETVYGLGADATRVGAVRKIFEAKGRPSTNPLIVHVASAAVAKKYAGDWPPAAEKLAGALWPGPITLVLPKASSIVAEVTAGKTTVGLRAPNHPLALELLKQFDGPLAGPSANRSTRVSPTTAEHVREQLGDRVDLILDGGPCAVGIESTVLDLTQKVPIILRPGGISRERIQEIIGRVDLFSGDTALAEAAASPGQHGLHYSPATAAYRFESNEVNRLEDWQRLHPAAEIVVLAIRPVRSGNIIRMPEGVKEYGRRLYAVLHEADHRGVDAIWIEMPPDEPEWEAIRDRIRRATRPAAGA